MTDQPRPTNPHGQPLSSQVSQYDYPRQSLILVTAVCGAIGLATILTFLYLGYKGKLYKQRHCRYGSGHRLGRKEFALIQDLDEKNRSKTLWTGAAVGFCDKHNKEVKGLGG